MYPRTPIVAAVVSLFLAPFANAAIQWRTADGGNEHYYEGIAVGYEGIAVGGSISWGDAKIAAENSGGYLVTLTSQDESDFVYANLVNDSALN